jgi:putative membrane protein
MGPGHYWWGGGWGMFPLMVPFFMIILIVAVLVLLFGRRGGQGQESAMDILKKRYAKGEISKEEFEQIKKDLTA